MSDDLKHLKERIYKDQNIEKILEELGCEKHEIKHEQRGELIVAPHPDGWNRRAVQVKNNPSLTSYIRNEGIEGDIFAIIGFFLYECKCFDDVRSKLYQIKTWVCNVLSYDDFVFSDFEKPKPKVDYNWWLRPIQKARSKEVEISKNEIIDEKILRQYVQYPWFGWVKDGISIDTQFQYGIGFDIQSERVTIPVRNSSGELIGVKGRYVGSDKETLEEKKYIYLYPCSKSIELFNLHRALPYIQEKKECIVVEGAKTTMLLHSWGFKNAVAIEGDKLSPVQAKILKNLGINIDVVIGFDKDKSKEYVTQQVKQIKGRQIFYLYDDENLFDDEKASPVDRGFDVWLKLYNGRQKLESN